MPEVQLIHANHLGIVFEVVGSEVRATVDTETLEGISGLPAGGNVGDVVKNTAPGEGDWSPETAAVLDNVLVFNNVSGEHYLELSTARTFRSTITGNVTTQRFTGLPNAGSWVWVIVMDATGGHALMDLHPVDRWVDARSYASLSTAANAVNIIVYTWDGTELSAALAWNGAVELDPYKLAIAENGVYAIPTDAESLDFANVTTPAGDATVTFKKNGAGADLTALTTFAVGDWLQVTVALLTTSTAVRIPRYAA